MSHDAWPYLDTCKDAQIYTVHTDYVTYKHNDFFFG